MTKQKEETKQETVATDEGVKTFFAEAPEPVDEVQIIDSGLGISIALKSNKITTQLLFQSAIEMFSIIKDQKALSIPKYLQ